MARSVQRLHLAHPIDEGFVVGVFHGDRDPIRDRDSGLDIPAGTKGRIAKAPKTDTVRTQRARTPERAADAAEAGTDEGGHPGISSPRGLDPAHNAGAAPSAAFLCRQQGGEAGHGGHGEEQGPDKGAKD